MVNLRSLSTEEHNALQGIAYGRTGGASLFDWSGMETQAKQCQSYSRALFEDRLSNRINRTVRVTSMDVVMGEFSNFVERVDSPSSLCSYLVGGKYRAALEMNQSLAFSVVDLLMGGRGRPPVETRPLSDLEQRFLSQIFDGFSDDLWKAWHLLVPHGWEMAQKVQFTYMLDGFTLDERVVITSYDVAIEDFAQGYITVAVPMSSMTSLNGEPSFEMEEKDILDSPLASVVPLRLEACLPTEDLTVERLLSIEEGDILELGSAELTDDEERSIQVVVHVEGHPRFVGKLGVVNRRKAVSILSRLDEGH